MGSRPIVRPPLLLTFSTRAAPLLRLPTLLRAAGDAGADGIDLDLAGRVALPSPRVTAQQVADQGLPVRALWLPAHRLAKTGRWPSRASDAAETAHLVGASTVVIPLPNPPGEPLPGTVLTRSVEGLRRIVPGETRVAVALGAGHLEGGRSHLARLTALRRLAEEWDFGVALDLVGRLDPRWEAEAAVARLGGKLELLRVPTLSTADRGDSRARTVARTIAVALDAGRPATFALVPAPDGWHRFWSPALSREWLTASQRIRARAAAVEADRILDVDPRPRPGFRA